MAYLLRRVPGAQLLLWTGTGEVLSQDCEARLAHRQLPPLPLLPAPRNMATVRHRQVPILDSSLSLMRDTLQEARAATTRPSARSRLPPSPSASVVRPLPPPRSNPPPAAADACRLASGTAAASTSPSPRPRRSVRRRARSPPFAPPPGLCTRRLGSRHRGSGQARVVDCSFWLSRVVRVMPRRLAGLGRRLCCCMRESVSSRTGEMEPLVEIEIVPDR